MNQHLRLSLLFFGIVCCSGVSAASDLVLPDGSLARTPDERIEFLKSYLALKIKSDLVKGETASALAYFQEIIDKRSGVIGYDFEEAMKTREKEEKKEQKIWEFAEEK